MTTLQERVFKVIAEVMALDVSEIALDAPIVDELDLIEIIMDLETEFDITIPDSETFEINAVSDAVRIVEKHANT